jgi:hypothetical protein
MKRLVVGMLLVEGLGAGMAAASAAPEPTEPIADVESLSPGGDPVLTDDYIFGYGPSGSLTAVPVCDSGSYFDFDVEDCAPTSTPVPAGTVQIALDSGCPVSGPLEGVFTTPAEMQTLVECILPAALQWISYEYQSADLRAPESWGGASLIPNNFIYVPTGVRIPRNVETCFQTDDQGEYAYSADDQKYCTYDGNIYLGEAALWADYTVYGDNTVRATIAHEMGHRIQHVAGVGTIATPNEAIPAENQADCFAGAFAAWSVRYGMSSNDTESVAEADVVDGIAGMLYIGDGEGADQTHGTADQRVRAYYIGYNSAPEAGVLACDFYVTDVSIIPAELSS